ncbi:unnamed protein product [Cuscuta campestris]|uniref:Uncharacterized protein n=1 Tax=Cuscuta campestris TaxID=132261 RepID=A0A484M2U4_9ASTE|nr:unnamed protein product [Cuscuta campestris]
MTIDIIRKTESSQSEVYTANPTLSSLDLLGRLSRKVTLYSSILQAKPLGGQCYRALSSIILKKQRHHRRREPAAGRHPCCPTSASNVAPRHWTSPPLPATIIIAVESNRRRCFLRRSSAAVELQRCQSLPSAAELHLRLSTAAIIADELPAPVALPQPVAAAASFARGLPSASVPPTTVHLVVLPDVASTAGVIRQMNLEPIPEGIEEEMYDGVAVSLIC